MVLTGARRDRIPRGRRLGQGARGVASITFLLLALAATSCTETGGDDVEVQGETLQRTDPSATDGTTGGGGTGGQTAAMPGLGSPARDGQFEFTISSFECGATTVGDEFLQEEAQGQFCIMNLRVQNIGDQAQSFAADNQYVFDADGTQYSASFEATLANNPQGDELFTEINPGNAVEGQVVFDVPPGTNVTYAELHDSFLSGGVRIDLRPAP